jgi:hypothetical protein
LRIPNLRLARRFGFRLSVKRPEACCQLMPSVEPVNIICLKWGTLYPAFYVNRLYAGVKKHLKRPFRFICVTENPEGLHAGVEAMPFNVPKGMPERLRMGFWTKLAVTADDFGNYRGPTLFLDIDQVITGSLDDFFDYKPGRNCIIHNWLSWHKTLFRPAPNIGNSSVFRFEAGKSQYIFDKFEREWPNALDRTRFRTEQAFLTYAMGDNREWWPAEWVRSFKRHCIPAFPLNLVTPPVLPADCRIVCFHGEPHPEVAMDGYDGGKRLYRRTKPAPWIREHWIENERGMLSL